MKIMTALAIVGILVGPAYAGHPEKASSSKGDWVAEMIAQTKTHGWAGLEFEKIKDEKGHVQKLAVKGVTPDSPAAAAGFAVGDVIVAINGHSIADAKAFKKDLVAGKTATYKVARKKGDEWAKTEIALTLAEPPREVLAQWIGYQLLWKAEQKQKKSEKAVAQANE